MDSPQPESPALRRAKRRVLQATTEQLANLTPAERREFLACFAQVFETRLDAFDGRCHVRTPEDPLRTRR